MFALDWPRKTPDWQLLTQMGKLEGEKKTYLHWLNFEKMNSYLGKNQTKIFLEGSQVLGATGTHQPSINFILNVTEAWKLIVKYKAPYKHNGIGVPLGLCGLRHLGTQNKWDARRPLCIISLTFYLAHKSGN